MSSGRFEDLAADGQHKVNPVQTALVQQLLGAEEARFSSFNSFVKWQGEALPGTPCAVGLNQNRTSLY